jgi:tyrosyl-tRNA synthetase
MLFRVSPDIFARFPDVFIAVVAADGVPNGAPVAAVEAELRLAEREAHERLTETGVDLQAHPFIARWRDAFRAAGINPNKYRSSVEALLTRVQKGSDVPALSPAVDLANAVSLRSWLPAGAHDVDRLADTLEVRLSREETFRPIGGAIPEAVEAGEIVYADARAVRTRRWIWRQGDEAKVTAASRRIFFPIDGWLGLNEEETREAAHELARLLRQHLGVRAEVAFVHKDNPQVRVLEDGAPGTTGTTDITGVDAEVVSPFTTRADVDGGDVLPVVPRDGDRRFDGDEIDELLGRGVVDVIVRADLERRLRAGEKLRVKLGIDPTGPRLHLGRAVPLRKLRQFQRLGHTICLIVGDFTAQIGDASDKTAERPMLSEMEVYQNMASYKDQIGRILDASKVEWSYNSDWLGQLRFKDVVELAKLFTVAQMLERENFSLRYSAGKPIGLQEFMYPLMQGYDSYAIEADVELGGTDQLFNLMAGRTVQQKGFAKRPQDIMTLGMIWGLDGRKMSTSEGNTVLIDEPPVDMYGKIMSMGDEQIIPYFEVATEVPWREIGELARALAGGLNPMSAKKRLAYEITRLYHGEAGAAEGQQYFEKLHQDKGALGDEEWPEVALSAEPRQIGALFKDAGLVQSNSDARRVMEQGGLEIDGRKVTDFAEIITPRDGMKLRRGKNKLARLRVVSSQ